MLSIFNKQATPIQIISRCPDSFHHKLAVKVKERAYRQNEWVKHNHFGEGNRRASYQTQFKAQDNLKNYQEAPKIGPQNTRLKNPTAEFMLTMFKLFRLQRKVTA